MNLLKQNDFITTKPAHLVRDTFLFKKNRSALAVLIFLDFICSRHIFTKRFGEPLRTKNLLTSN